MLKHMFGRDALIVQDCLQNACPIPSVWGHMAGSPGANPVDMAFVDSALRELLAS
ncbi:MAG: hypothetical protein V3S24_15150 [Candidatus Tectomicrobia bacterium]